MKPLVTVVVALYLSLPAWATSLDDSLIKSQAKDDNVFVLKSGKNLVGANVEIYASNGNLVTSQQLHKKRMIIDFKPVRKDTYTIRVVKGKSIQLFEFIKR